MERLVLLVLKLLLQLTWWLLKLAVRLVLFVWSGDWHKLDKLVRQFEDAVAEARRGQPTPARPPRVRPAKAPAPTRDEPWPFEFAPELSEREPDDELRGGETVIQPTFAPRSAARKRRQAPSRDLPLALALRDPRVVRDAMVLTALLGRPARPGRRF